MTAPTWPGDILRLNLADLGRELDAAKQYTVWLRSRVDEAEKHEESLREQLEQAERELNGGAR